jgi:hypothetical protein
MYLLVRIKYGGARGLLYLVFEENLESRILNFRWDKKIRGKTALPAMLYTNGIHL